MTASPLSDAVSVKSLLEKFNVYSLLVILSKKASEYFSSVGFFNPPHIWLNAVIFSSSSTTLFSRRLPVSLSFNTIVISFFADVSSDAVICVLLVSLFVAVVFVSLLHPDIANIHNNATKMIPLDFIVSHLSLSDYFLLPFSFHIIPSIQQCYTIILAWPPPRKNNLRNPYIPFIL